MVRVILIYIFSIIAFNSFSQGYMGHKLEVRYNSLLSTRFVQMVVDDNIDFGVDYSHNISLGVVMNKATEFFIEYENYNYNYIIDGKDYYNQIISEWIRGTDTPVLIMSNSFGLGFRFYSTEWLAPLGLYNQLDVLLSFAKSKSLKTNNYGAIVDELIYPRIGWALGSQRVLVGNLMYDIGLQTYISFVNPFTSGTTKRGVFFRNVFSFKLGLTYVI